MMRIIEAIKKRFSPAAVKPFDVVHEWGPLEVLNDRMLSIKNGLPPVGHRCLIHKDCFLNTRTSKPRDLEEIAKRTGARPL